uniref:PDEase domain-containing protein n=1 Tax=Hucho hucho TaxID=62062 RepID=A0A4W5PD40_9TELE
MHICVSACVHVCLCACLHVHLHACLHFCVCVCVWADVCLSVEFSVDMAKVLSLMLHAADISHPAKDWPLHYYWTQALMEEFFRQGDKEAELGQPFSLLCDRNTTMIAQSQIGRT